MRYKITTLKNHQPHTYILYANDKEHALQKAQSRDKITPICIQEAPFFFPIPKQDLIHTLQQFHLMSSANLPLQLILQNLKLHTHNKRLSQIFHHIALSLENGLSLYESFLPYEHIFGNLTLTFIRLGSQSGKLTECLDIAIKHITQEQKYKKAIQKALFYPCFVLFSTLICFAFVLHSVVPQFIHLFSTNQVALPLYTRILIYTQEFISTYGVLSLVILLGLIALCVFECKTRGFLFQPLLTLSLHLPLVKSILLNAYLYQYTLTLSLLLKSGLDLQTCITLSQQSIPSTFIKNKLHIIQSSLLNGKSFSFGLQQSQLFQPPILNLIHIAQQNNSLEHILEICANDYYQRNADKIAFLISLIEPLLTLLLGGFILLLALGIFVPIWNL